MRTITFTPRNTESVREYYKDIRRYDVLPIEEERKLGRDLKMGGCIASKAGEQLTLHNLRIVLTIAKNYQGCGVDWEDLVQYGNEGLVEGVYHFDIDRGIRFSSFIVFWIRKGIIEGIQQTGQLVHLPKNQLENIRVIDRYVEEYGVYPTASELSDFGQISYAQAVAILNHSTKPMEWDAPAFDEEDGATVGDTIMFPNFEDDMYRAERTDVMRSRCEQILTPHEWRIISLIYGFGGVPLSTGEIASHLCISEAAIRKTHSRALERLRRNGNMLRNIA